MVSKTSLQSATKTADKNNGGQALDLLTIALKTGANKPKAEIYWPTQGFSAK
jgi:hypothetical protein